MQQVLTARCSLVTCVAGAENSKTLTLEMNDKPPRIALCIAASHFPLLVHATRDCAASLNINDKIRHWLSR